MLPAISIVWFKRDLRLNDHAPLDAAIRTQLPVLLLHFFEPSWMRCADSDLRHWRFVWQSVQDMQNQLRQRGIPFWSSYCEAIDFFDDLRTVAEVKNIFSHVETGNAHTYARDRAIAQFCQQHGIVWHEFPTAGVRRSLYHRNNWEQYFIEVMQQPLAQPQWSQCLPFHLPDAFVKKWLHRASIPDALSEKNDGMQPGGEIYAHRYLHSFLEVRHRHYSKHLSKPEAARHSCSRLSPYLTWGNLSTRQVFQATQQTIRQHTGDAFNLRQFTSRLFWQSHFIQKFETECRMEFENLNRGFDTIRREVNDEWVAAWQTGRTGYPLVDACMRCVIATGYLNFRMRSMLVSFLTHHLWQPWQAGAHHLARQFLDYEPGIHYSQFQMQAGTMGVNTFRIYNPVKQSIEHDPDAVFIKKWVPELALLPTPFAHEPWKLTRLEAAMLQFRMGIDYPHRLVDVEKTHAQAREILWKLRQTPEVKAENARILRIHTKRKDVNDSTVMGNFRVQKRLKRHKGEG